MMNETIEALKKTEKASATAIDLIIRQQAKIEELKAENERLEKENKNLLSKLCQKVRTVSKAVEKHIKAEAYKEFANELKCRTHEISYNTAQVVTRCDIDNLLKEMVGGSDE